MNELNGRPIEGEITVGNEMAEQHANSKFTDALDTLLDTEGVEAVRWTGFTPYFCDGDPCVYGINDPYIRVIGTEKDEEDYEDGFLDRYSLEDGPQRTALNAFAKVLCGGHHDALLISKFGDHVQVTATKEKFVLDEYSHD